MAQGPCLVLGSGGSSAGDPPLPPPHRVSITDPAPHHWGHIAGFILLVSVWSPGWQFHSRKPGHILGHLLLQSWAPRGPWGQRVSFRASFSSLTLPWPARVRPWSSVLCVMTCGHPESPPQYSTALALGHLLTAPYHPRTGARFFSHDGRWHPWPQLFTLSCVQALCHQTAFLMEGGAGVWDPGGRPLTGLRPGQKRARAVWSWGWEGGFPPLRPVSRSLS